MNQDISPRRWAWWRGILLALSAVVIIGLAAWYFAGNSSTQQAGRGRPAATVGTAKAVLADMPVTLSAIGTVQPLVTATVRPQVTGTLFSIDFTEGQMVTKGQKLAQIDPRPFRLALAPMTNDFVALLKDSSLVSVITVVELTKQTSIFAANIGSWLLPGILCAGMYLALSLPLARLARRIERGWRRE